VVPRRAFSAFIFLLRTSAGSSAAMPASHLSSRASGLATSRYCFTPSQVMPPALCGSSVACWPPGCSASGDSACR
jgi:hypothetical protein